MNNVFTPNQIAKMCAVSAGTVYRWTDEGWLPCYKIEKRRFIKKLHLIEFLKEHGMYDYIIPHCPQLQEEKSNERRM